MYWIFIPTVGGVGGWDAFFTLATTPSHSHDSGNSGHKEKKRIEDMCRKCDFRSCCRQNVGGWTESTLSIPAAHESISYPPPSHLDIHMDSTTSFGIFNLLQALDPLQPHCPGVHQYRIKYGVNLCVFHIKGKKIVVADALLWCLTGLACQLISDQSSAATLIWEC